MRRKYLQRPLWILEIQKFDVDVLNWPHWIAQMEGHNQKDLFFLSRDLDLDNIFFFGFLGMIQVQKGMQLWVGGPSAFCWGGNSELIYLWPKPHVCLQTHYLLCEKKYSTRPNVSRVVPIVGKQSPQNICLNYDYINLGFFFIKLDSKRQSIRSILLNIWNLVWIIYLYLYLETIFLRAYYLSQLLALALWFTWKDVTKDMEGNPNTWDFCTSTFHIRSYIVNNQPKFSTFGLRK